MAIRTFWIIVIKILGLWLIFGFLEVFSQVVATMSYLFISDISDKESIWTSLIISISILLVYLFIIGFFVFKSSWIVDKLKLDKNSGSEVVQIDLKISTIVTIAVIIIGGVFFINGFSLFCKSLFDFFQEKKIHNNNPTTNWIIFNSIKALLGYLLMTNSKVVVNYIMKQSKHE